MTENEKKLKEEYKNTKKDMGLYKIYSQNTKNTYIGIAKDLKGIMNSMRFQLNLGSYPNKQLQNEWKEQGSDSFVIEVLDTLSYSNDQTKTDYSDDLKMLAEIWHEKIENSFIL